MRRKLYTGIVLFPVASLATGKLGRCLKYRAIIPAERDGRPTLVGVSETLDWHDTQRQQCPNKIHNKGELYTEKCRKLYKNPVPGDKSRT